jgi:hypothetical protein
MIVAEVKVDMQVFFIVTDHPELENWGDLLEVCIGARVFGHWDEQLRSPPKYL